MMQKCVICKTKNIVDGENTCSSECSTIYVKAMLLVIYEKRREGYSQRQKQYSKKYSQKPGVKEKRNQYAKEYRERPEVKKRLKEDNQKPEVKERKKEYRERPG